MTKYKADEIKIRKFIDKYEYGKRIKPEKWYPPLLLQSLPSAKLLVPSFLFFLGEATSPTPKENHNITILVQHMQWRMQ